MRRLHGDLITTTLTAGLHRLPEYGGSRVTAASEFKKRLFSSIYYNDKTHASLSGTPPLLTQLFCNTQPCLDLPNEAIFLPQDELALAVSKLDPDGSDRSASDYHVATFMRARLRFCTIREEILELSLGVNVDSSEARIKYVVQHSWTQN